MLHIRGKALIAVAAALVVGLSPLVGPAHSAAAQQPGNPGRAGGGGRPEVRDDELLVKFRPGTAGANQAAAHSQAGGRVDREIRSLDVKVVKVPPGQAANRLQQYQQNRNVEYAELNGIAYVDGFPTDAPPSDQKYGQQWALNNTGQTGGKADADVDAPQAWRVTTGSASPVSIAIVDTGIFGSHPDLQGKVTESANWAGGNSVDASDGYGHGTHVAGIAAAQTNNGEGIAGVCPGCTLVSAKVCDNSGACNYDWIASGVLWSVGCEVRNPDTSTDYGACLRTVRAKVLNLSLGGTYNSITLGRAIKRAWDQGAVPVCAAGNNANSVQFYPAVYPECIAVAATDSRDQKGSFSNHGSWVDVAAPGVSVLSSVTSGGYEAWSGTSMASPHVAGLAGLVWSTGAYATPQKVREQIEKADPIRGTGRQWAKGRINACKAVGGTGC